MNLLESIRVALRGLAANKLRSGLTVLGIVIGVAAVITLVALGAGAQAQVTAQFQTLGSNLLVVASRGSGSLTLADAEAIARLSRAVRYIAPEYSVRRTVAFGRENTDTGVVGVTPEYLTVRNWQVARGRFIDAQDVENQAKVVALGQAVVEELFGNTLLDPVGKTVKINRQNYQVVGIMASKGGGFLNLDDQVFIPLSTAQVRFGGAGNTALANISLQVASAEKMDLTQTEVAAILRTRHGLRSGQTDDFYVLNQADILQTVEQTTQIFTVLLGSIAAISLLVGGIGIMNIMLVSVTERTREIGIRKAVGAKYRDILLQFLVEAVVLSLLGGVVGILVGWGGARALSSLLQGLMPVVTPEAVLMAVSVSVAIGIFFGLYPANRAAQLNPIEALRYE